MKLTHYHLRADVTLTNLGNSNYTSENQFPINIRRIIFGFRETSNLFSFIYRKSIVAFFHDQILFLIYVKVEQYENR